MTDPIFEAAAQCLEEWDSYQHEMMAESVLRVVTPLIRAAALEEAALEAEDCVTGEDAAYNIRLLKEQP